MADRAGRGVTTLRRSRSASTGAELTVPLVRKQISVPAFVLQCAVLDKPDFVERR
jgi:hypothetical protein